MIAKLEIGADYVDPTLDDAAQTAKIDALADILATRVLTQTIHYWTLMTIQHAKSIGVSMAEIGHAGGLGKNPSQWWTAETGIKRGSEASADATNSRQGRRTE